MVKITCDIGDINCSYYKKGECELPFNQCTHQKKPQKELPLWNEKK